MFHRPWPGRATQAGALLVLLVLATLLAACSGAASAPDVQAPRPITGGSGDEGGQPLRPDDQPPAAEDGEGQIQDGALIVRTGHLALEVTDLAAAIDGGGRLVSGLGGYVSASEEESYGSRQLATITYRIPSDRWAEALAGLRALGSRVISENTEAVEVTAEVVDLEARIANERAAEAALQEIMTRAGSIDDVLKVQRELANVRGEIESMTARLESLQERAAYGTLAVGYEVPVVAVDAAQEGWQPATEVDRATAQLVRILQGLVSLVIWLGIVVLPVVLPVALLAYGMYRLRRRFATASPPPGPIGPSV